MGSRIFLVRRVLLTLGFLAIGVCFSGQIGLADSFDWRNIEGYNWNSTVKGQFGGTCWAHAGVGALESHYMLTRNDASYVPDVSEQQLVWETSPDMGSTDGGGGHEAFAYCVTHGVVSEAECPLETDSAYWNKPSSTDPWPLATGWEDRVIKGTTYSIQITSTTDYIKNALKQYGPMHVALSAGNDLYSTIDALKSNYHTPRDAVDHAVVVVGYYDDASCPTGGYWVIKNSWGSTAGDGTGYYYAPYGNIENHNTVDAMTGPVYYTGAMAASTWKGGSKVWSNGGENWTKTQENGVAVAAVDYVWENKETSATFNASTTGTAITLDGSVISHGLTISTNAKNYSFSGGSLTVTAGGIVANESLTVNSPIYVGAPQVWSVRTAKTLTINGPLHTLISDLIIGGGGNTVINGAIDGGGILNSFGAKPGGLIKATTGNVTLSGTSHFSGDITARAISGKLSIVPPAGSTDTATFDGAFFGSGPIDFTFAGNLKLSGGASIYSGALTVHSTSASVLDFVTASGVTGKFSGKITDDGALLHSGLGTTILSGTNSYPGTTTIAAGALQADIGVGIPTTSQVILDGGVLQSHAASSFTGNFVDAGGILRWGENGGGFSAGSSNMIVNIGGNTTAPILVEWDSSPSDGGSKLLGALKLSSSSAQNVTTFQNPMALNGAIRTVQVDDNVKSAFEYAVLAGVLSDGSGSAGITKTGAGMLVLSRTNTYTGPTTISGGILKADVGVGIPKNSRLILDGGMLQLNAATIFGGMVEMTANGGGFTAGSASTTVNVGGHATPDLLVWGSSAGSQLAGTLRLNSPAASAALTFQNGIDLNGDARTLTVAANSVYLTGAIQDAVGGGSFTKTGTGTLYITGSPGNTYAGSTTILGGDVYLNKTAGYAIPGDLTLGGSNQLFVNVQADNQIASTASLHWCGTGAWQEIKLLGHNQTVAGIFDSTGRGVIENTWDEAGYAKTTLTVNNTVDCSFNGCLRDQVYNSGSVLALTKSGTGTLALSGDNISYTGGTKVEGGTLALQDITNAAFLAGSISIAADSVLEFRAANKSMDFTGTLTGAGSLNKTGWYAMTLGANARYTGGTTVTNGVLTLNDVSDPSFLAAPFAIENYSSLEINAATTDINLTGPISGSGSFMLEGTKTVTISGATGNTFTGTTSLYGGDVNLNKTSGYAISGDLSFQGSTDCVVSLLGDNQIAPSATIYWQAYGGTQELKLLGHNLTVAGISCWDSGVIENTKDETGSYGTAVLTVNTVSGSSSFSGTLRDSSTGSGALALVKDGAARLTLSGVNTYTGNTTIKTGGPLCADDGVGLPSTSLLVLDGGILQGNTGATFKRGIGVSAGDVQWTSNGGGFSASIYYPLTVNIGGNSTPSTLDWGDSVGTQIVGTLRLHSSSSRSVTTFVNPVNLNGVARTIQVDGYVNTDHYSYYQPYTYAVMSGVIADGSGAAGIVKTGSGMLALTGANTYSGATTISSGTLQADDSVGLPSGSFLSLDGGVLQSNTATTFSRPLGVSGNAFQWTANGGGFSAGANPLTVNIGGHATPDTLDWGNSVGSQIVGTLKLSSALAKKVTTFVNPVNLNGANRTIHVAYKYDFNDYYYATSYSEYAVMSGVIADGQGGPGAITKTGSGMLMLTGNNTYSGGTNVDAGLLSAPASASLGAPGSTIRIASRATLKVGDTLNLTNHAQLTNSGTLTGSLSISDGAKAQGSGQYGAVAVSSGGTFSPGNGIGSATTASASWQSGGKYVWEINSTDGYEGWTWDYWYVSGSLSIDAGSSPFTISVASFDSSNQAGSMTDFDATVAYSWMILSTGQGISGFSADAIQLDTGLLQNDLCGGRLYLSQSEDASQLFLNFAPAVPEPCSLAFLAVLGIALGSRWFVKKMRQPSR